MASRQASRASSLAPYLCLVVCGILSPIVRGITYTIKEEAAVDSFIGNVSADSNLNSVVGGNEFSSLRYSILSGGSGNGRLFKIGSSTGILSVADRVDREQLCPFTSAACKVSVEIAAQYESLLRKFNVEIVVEDINDHSPRFPSETLAPYQLSEATSVNFPVSLDVATDLDSSENFTVKSYTLGPAGVPFRVVKETNAVGMPLLSLVVDRELDREQRSSYSLVIWAYDGGDPRRSGSVAFTVNILDVNDNSPVFTSDVYKKNISESTPRGTPILTVSATDADEGDNAKVRYSISTQQPSKDQGKLSIGTTSGTVSVAQELRAGLHRILIEAQDQGNPPKPPTQAVLEVTVLDTDNSPPVPTLDLLSVSDFEPGFVPESEKVGTAVGFFSVSDPDSGANALVTCESQNEHFSLQSLNLNEYKVIISKALDRENSSYYNVMLVCFDGGSPKLTSTATFDVWVLDENDNPPVFLEDSYSASVAENNGIMDGLVQVAATDADNGRNANVTYRIAGGQEGDEEQAVQIGFFNGMIKARVKFDYETRRRYVFAVVAMDQGERPLSATTTVTINVLDINDVAPRFSATGYNFTVRERLQPGVSVGNVSVSDPDTGLGGEVTMSMVQRPGFILPFDLSPSGELITTATLDREQHPTFTFYLLAKDKGMRPLTSSVKVTVSVGDVNDNAPAFLFASDNHTRWIPVPAQAELVVANVRAIDPDSGRNGEVTYSVVGGNASRLFRVEPNTGAVVTLTSLGLAQLGSYRLVVRATDLGRPQPLHADRNLTLLVVKDSGHGGAGGGGGGALGGGDGGSGSDASQSYVIIVVCIVLFTLVVSAGVVVTMCVLRKLDRDRKLKYSAPCYPPDGGLGAMQAVDLSSTEYHQQVSAVSGDLDLDSKWPESDGFGGQGHQTESRYSSHPGKLVVDLTEHKLDSPLDKSNASLSSQDKLSTFSAQPRSSNVRTSQLSLSLSQAQSGRKTPLQLDVVRRADDFHSTSSTETTTGDSGHGSDEDVANHSHDNRPLSPSSGHHHHHQQHHHHPQQHQQPQYYHPHHQQQQNFHRNPPVSSFHPHPKPQGLAATPTKPSRLAGVGGVGGGGGVGLGLGGVGGPRSASPFALPGGGNGGGGAAGGGGGNSSSRSKLDSGSTSSALKPAFSQGGQFRSSGKPYSCVRFSSDVTSLESPTSPPHSPPHHHHHLHQQEVVGAPRPPSSSSNRGRYASNESIRDDDSDLNTTTSGSFSVPPDDLYENYRHHDLDFGGHRAGRKFERDMLV